MGTPTEELEAKLAQFEQLRPNEGLRLRAMIAGSPELNDMLLEVVASGNLEGGFEPVESADRANNNTGGRYYQDRGAMAVATDLLMSNVAKDNNTLLMTLGHETAHAIDRAAIDENYDLFFADLDTVAAGRPPRDYTAAAKGFQDRSRTTEAHAEIAGVNVLAADIKRDNPGATQEQLYQLLCDSTSETASYFDVSSSGGNTTCTPKRGIVFNDQFQLETNAAQTAAFGEHFFDAFDYPQKVGKTAVDLVIETEIHAFKAEMALAEQNELEYPLGMASVDLGELGVDPNSVWLPGFMNGFTPPRSVSPEPAPPATAPATPELNIPISLDATPGRPDGPALSPASDAVLRDSERFVRQLADKHQLPWDAGLDNTVAAMARSAREAGMTAVTHFTFSDGTLRFAQHDGFGIKEASLDAKTGANTAAAESLERLEALDREAPPRPAPQPARHIEEALFR